MELGKEAIPQGTLKILNIADIKVGQRFRENLGNIDDLAASMRDKGVLQPITVSTEMKLLAGGRRIAAAQLAGLTKIPALLRKLEKTNEELDSREIELIENINRKDFEWYEQDRLIAEIDRLYKEKNIAWEVTETGGMKPGWSGRRTAELLGKSVQSVATSIKRAAAVEAIPELAEYKTADDAMKVIRGMEEEVIIQEMRDRQRDPNNQTLDRGMKRMLQLADSNYIVGDTFKGLAELRSTGSVSIIECDPPYGIDLTKQKRSKDDVVSTVHGYQEITAEDYPAFLTKLANELYRVAGTHCWLVFWFGPTWHTEVRSALKTAGWQVDDIPCIWVKETGQTMSPELYLGRAYEPFFMCRKGNPTLMKRGRLNVFRYPGALKKYHPTERPVDLIEDVLGTLGVPASIVLVPFLGSGATIRAAYNLGMKVFGFDSDPKYKDQFMLAVEEDTRRLGEDTTGEDNGE